MKNWITKKEAANKYKVKETTIAKLASENNIEKKYEETKHFGNISVLEVLYNFDAIHSIITAEIEKRFKIRTSVNA